MIWNDVITNFMQSETGVKLKEEVSKRRKVNIVYPAANEVFKAYLLTPLDKIKIVMLGLDPYNTGDHAHGLLFSSKRESTPKSLEIVLKELRRDLYSHLNEIQWKQFFPHNNLTEWANRGILLINRYLTVDEGKPKSHASLGWDVFTRKVFEVLNDRKEPIVFIFWGNDAKEIAPLITNTRHLKLLGAHPAADAYNPTKPLFAGCGHFSKAAEFLKTQQDPYTIDFDIEKYFKDDMYSEFLKILKSFGYPMIYEDEHALIDDFKKSLNINFNFGFDFTLTK